MEGEEGQGFFTHLRRYWGLPIFLSPRFWVGAAAGFLPHGSQAGVCSRSFRSGSSFLSLSRCLLSNYRKQAAICLVLLHKCCRSYTPGATKASVLGRLLCSLPHTAISKALFSLALPLVCFFHLLIRNRHSRKKKLTHSGTPFLFCRAHSRIDARLHQAPPNVNTASSLSSVWPGSLAPPPPPSKYIL